MSKSPTARTLERVRQLGGHVGVTERYNTFSRKRHDLFGFIDLVAILDGHIIGIQATSTGNINTRWYKIQEECHEPALDWLQAGGLIEVWGWKRYKKSLPDDRRTWRETILCLTKGDL